MDYSRRPRRLYNDPPMTPDFRNEPIIDFSRNAEAKTALQHAIDAFVPVDCPLVIGGARLATKASIVSHNPCQPGRITPGAW